MAGHSKWANIKHRKAAADAKRGQAFSKIAKEITVAARLGGGDPEQNISLRPLIQKARGVNMPADNIERAIKKGTGELNDGAVFESMTYEGYASGGVGVIVQALTDNRNRTASEIRHCFTKAGNSLGTPGSVSRSFQRKGMIAVPLAAIDEEALLELVLEAGGENLEEDDGVYAITTDPASYMAVVDALNARSIPIESSELTMIPDLYTEVTDLAQAKAVMAFVEALEDLDDVQDVYTSMDISPDVMAQLNAEG